MNINRRNAIGHTNKIAESINLDIDPLSLILTGLIEIEILPRPITIF